ncbi:MAG: hypothetical protein GY861_17910 [bacterium]|nr:hypothetical protein [bacterium]
MAETRETFTIIENGSAEGQPLLSRQDGVTSAATGNHAGVLAYKDSGGNDVKPQLSAAGQVPVTFASGTPASGSASVTMAALSTEQDVVSVAVAVNDVVEANMAMGSAFQPMLWVLYHNDDSTLNELARFVTGPGDFSHSTALSNINFTAGASGTQELVLRATQLRGALTDAHGTISLSVAP